MRACKHYESSLGDETDIVPSSGHIWNAWLEVWDGDRKIVSDFRAGLRLEYFQHLSENPECCQEVGVDIEAVKEELEEIEQEWKAVTGGS